MALGVYSLYRRDNEKDFTLPITLGVVFGVLVLTWIALFVYVKLNPRNSHPWRRINRHPSYSSSDLEASISVREKGDHAYCASCVDRQRSLYSPPTRSCSSCKHHFQRSQSSASLLLEPVQGLSPPPPTMSRHGRKPSIASFITSSTRSVAFASPAMTLGSMKVTPRTKERAFGPMWFYSPRSQQANTPNPLPSQALSPLSGEFDIRDNFAKATWGGPHLTAMLEGSESSSGRTASSWPRNLV